MSDNDDQIKKSNKFTYINKNRATTNNVRYHTNWGHYNKSVFLLGLLHAHTYAHKHTVIITNIKEMSVQPQTPVMDPQVYTEESPHVSSPITTWRWQTRFPYVRIWFTTNSLITTGWSDWRWICNCKRMLSVTEVTLRSLGPAPLRLFPKWSLARPPLPGTAPPSVVLQRCRPWTPTTQRPPSAPASAAAVRTPKMQPRWVYVQLRVKENSKKKRARWENIEHCLTITDLLC